MSTALISTVISAAANLLLFQGEMLATNDQDAQENAGAVYLLDPNPGPLTNRNRPRPPPLTTEQKKNNVLSMF